MLKVIEIDAGRTLRDLGRDRAQTSALEEVTEADHPRYGALTAAGSAASAEYRSLALQWDLTKTTFRVIREVKRHGGLIIMGETSPWPTPLVTIYCGSICLAVPREQVEAQARRVVRHEIGHVLGMSEEQLTKVT